jgi:hypothetical protein
MANIFFMIDGTLLLMQSLVARVVFLPCTPLTDHHAISPDRRECEVVLRI